MEEEDLPDRHSQQIANAIEAVRSPSQPFSFSTFQDIAVNLAAAGRVFVERRLQIGCCVSVTKRAPVNLHKLDTQRVVPLCFPKVEHITIDAVPLGKWTVSVHGQIPPDCISVLIRYTKGCSRPKTNQIRYLCQHGYINTIGRARNAPDCLG